MATYLDLPIGSIIAWGNAAIPAGWAACDGTGGTPDLRDKFVYGAAVDGDIRGTGGSDTHTHAMNGTSTRATHNHGGSKAVTLSSGATVWVTIGSGRTAASADHTHSASVPIVAAAGHSHTVGTTGSGSNLPTYIKRVFIRRMT